MDDERIVAADASNLIFDGASRVNAFVLAGVLAPGGFVDRGGDVDLDEARRILVPRAEAVPRLGEKADTSGRVWRWRKTAIDPERHVRLAPTCELEDLCSQLMVTPLDHSHPLWEVLLIPRVDPGRAGIVVRVHHAIADGAAAAGIMSALADPPEASSAAPASPSAEPLRGLRGVWAAADQWVKTLRTPRLGDSSLLGDASGRRSVRFVAVDLAGFHAGATAAGGTLNDAVLAVVAGAVAAALRERGEEVPRDIGVSVPVAVRRRRGEGNALSGALVSVPLQISEVGDRIRSIHPIASAAVERARLSGVGAPMRSRRMMRIFVRYADRQRLIGVVMSTLRGPVVRLRFGGSELVEAYPVGTLGGNVRVSIVAISYAGSLSWGVQTASPLRADVIAQALRAEAGRIIALASPPAG